MINEANEALSHFGLVARIAAIFERRRVRYATEVRLPNKKIADLIYLGIGDTVHIIEAKIDFRPVHLTEARYHYGDYCDYLWIALPVAYELPPAVTLPGVRWSSPDDATGIVRVDREGMGFVRAAHPRHPHASARAQATCALLTRLTGGEQTPGALAGPAAEQPKNNSAGHKGRRCAV
jgi:hypothetical protein